MKMKQQYEVQAYGPTTGGSMDSRHVGPFESRRIAEDAAARLVDDPRRWANIVIVTVEVGIVDPEE